ncbi:TPA: hypothetical protein ACIUMH_001810, partial [Salmonella enterica subsp. enterica serovar Oslo]
QTYQVTPQAYRQQINENSHPPSL